MKIITEQIALLRKFSYFCNARIRHASRRTAYQGGTFCLYRLKYHWITFVCHILSSVETFLFKHYLVVFKDSFSATMAGFLKVM